MVNQMKRQVKKGIENWINHIRVHIHDPKEVERSLGAIENLIEMESVDEQKIEPEPTQ